MEKEEYFPFIEGDKLVSPNAYDDKRRRGFTTFDGIHVDTDAYMTITGIGATMFFASWDGNEHVHSKLGEYELYNKEKHGE